MAPDDTQSPFHPFLRGGQALIPPLVTKVSVTGTFTSKVLVIASEETRERSFVAGFGGRVPTSSLNLMERWTELNYLSL